MVMIKSNEQLTQEENAAAEANVKAEEGVINNEALLVELSGYIQNRWNTAKRAKKEGIEDQFFKNIDQARNTYDSRKLAAIKEIQGSEVFVGVTDTKCRHAVAWVRDILQQPGVKPWGVEPTPVPELPPETISSINQRFMKEAMDEMYAESQASGIPTDPALLMQTITEQLPKLHDRLEKELKSEAWRLCAAMEKEIDDKLIDGDWYSALNEGLTDFVVLGTMIMKGPIKRQRKVLSYGKDGKVQVEDRVIEEFEARSPFDIYPQPDSTGPQDGYWFDKYPYRKLDLQQMVGLEGMDSKEILAVLKEAGEGKFREWTQIESERAEREKGNTIGVYDTDLIDCLEYNGPVPGEMLAKHNVKIPKGQEDFDFDAVVWLIGNHVIKAIINEDPLGRRPCSIAQFDENRKGWWGRGLPQLIDAEQVVSNACARAIVNNIGMGSGPQVEINVDRLRGGDKGDMRLIPWKRWLTTNKLMQTGPAIQFWQPQIYSDQILNVFRDFIKGADERSNIPAYAHGDSQVGGAGNTASGLSMLITQATRGIRNIIKIIDDMMITKSIIFLFEKLALNPKFREKMGDVKLVAKGSTALIEKEQRAIRMLEFLNATNNPVDFQIMGNEGRGYLLGEVAKAHEIDPEKAMPNLAAIRRQTPVPPAPPAPPAQNAAPGAPGEAPQVANRGTPPVVARNLAPGGLEPQGGAAQLIGGRGGPAEAPPGGVMGMGGNE